MSRRGNRRTGLKAADRIRDFIGRRRGEIKRRLAWVPGIAGVTGAVVAGFLAPVVDDAHPPDRLQGFFAVAIGVVMTIFITFGILQLTARPERVLRFLHLRTFVPPLLGMAAAAVGLITSLDAWIYKYLFAIAVGSGLHAVVLALLVGAVSLAEQRAAGRAARAG